MNIDALDAGPELDTLIAEQLFGHVWMQHAPHQVSLSDDGQPYRFLVSPEWIAGLGDDPSWVVVPADMTRKIVYQESTPRYSTDISAAWQVCQVMEARGWWCQMRTPFDTSTQTHRYRYYAGFTPHKTTGWNGTPDHWTPAPSLPLAICRAALKANARSEDEQ